MVQKLEPESVGRKTFMQLTQQYFRVAQSITMTPAFALDSKEKPVRKAEAEEIVELVEGPKKEAKTGLERIKAKALRDGAQGWITPKGNQGKVFLAEVAKPYYVCMRECTLEKECKSSSEKIRTLKADEVLELVAGPSQ